MSDILYVIDDDDDLRESIVEILEADGFEVRSFRTAEDALNEVSNNFPALVVVDNMMPGMGGMAFVPLLKKNRPDVKIVMITAFSTVDNAVTAMKAGVDVKRAKH